MIDVARYDLVGCSPEAVLMWMPRLWMSAMLLCMIPRWLSHGVSGDVAGFKLSFLSVDHGDFCVQMKSPVVVYDSN